MVSIATSNNTWITAVKSKVSKAYKYDEKGQIIKQVDAEAFNAASGAAVKEKINNAYGVELKYNLAGKAVEVLDAVSKEKGLSYTEKT